LTLRHHALLGVFIRFLGDAVQGDWRSLQTAARGGLASHGQFGKHQVYSGGELPAWV
jgi:hypothetical protein